MPKHTRSASSNHNRYTMPVSLAPAANPTPNMYSQQQRMPMAAEYYAMSSNSAASMQAQQQQQQRHQVQQQQQQQQAYDAYAAAAAAAPAISAPPVQHRASSGAWTPQDDSTLLAARAQGLNWSQIQANYFGNKTPNACRKRHERLMERKGADDWDNRKLERLAKEYMTMRKEIWQGLAARTGEKWNVVEAKCMSNGLKNLQSAARAAARRERLESGQPLPPGYDDDSGISGIGLTPVDDLDASYSSPESASSGGHSIASAAGYNAHAVAAAGSHFAMQPLHAGQYYGAPQAHHGYTSSVSSSSAASGPYGTGAGNGHPGNSQSPSPYLHPLAQRLPSVDSVGMGIEAIINRPGGAQHQQM
ncbi:myb family transcription factor [Plectosphaerella plurivora]|uniref:Myb family transcription factor n=1 Tax=Plectosphaerella plurivora TaxID=936078 RepID=A0A9P8V2L2_9PEZI|nr:myb family transcription factor [Plectosphaerella plurivora]